MVPSFNKDGVLPEGIHFTDFNSFSDQFGFSNKRRKLLEGLSKVISILRQAGCTRIFIDGSFVTDKELPNDIDCCWEGDYDEISRKLQILEPCLLDFLYGRRRQKLKFGCEFFHSEMYLIDQYRNRTKAIDFFQQIRFSSKKKGIIGLNI